MTEQNYQRAIGFVLVTTICSVIMNSFIKTLGHDIDPITIIFLRSIFTLPFLWLIMKRKNIPLEFTPAKLKLHFPRSLIGMTSYACMLYAVQIMPLANATAISLAQPLFVALLAPLLLKEHLHRETIIMPLLGFIGILLILKPTAEIPISDAFIIIMNPVLFALALINVRHLSKTENSWVTVFFYSFFSAALSAPWAIFHLPQLPINHFIVLIAVALTGIGLQYSQVKSLTYAPTTLVAPYYYSGQLWSLMIGVIFWQEWPDSLAWMGITLIIGMGIALNWIARRKHFAITSP